VKKYEEGKEKEVDRDCTCAANGKQFLPKSCTDMGIGRKTQERKRERNKTLESGTINHKVVITFTSVSKTLL